MSRQVIDLTNGSVASIKLTNPLFVALLVAMVGIASGCTSTGGSPTGRGGAHDNTDTVTTAASVRHELPLSPARVEIEDNVGFTVTEVVLMSGQARADYREAVRLLAQKDYANGIRLLEQVTDKAPDATAPFVDLGIAYAHAGNLERAAESFSQALKATPDHPVAHNELGIVYRKLGRFQDARRSYQSALSIYPGFHYARRNLAVLCDLYLADYQCALEHYQLYQQAVADDREVDMWVVDIQNRAISHD